MERNRNVIEYQAGNRYRLEITTANLMRCEPEFTVTYAEAKRRRKARHADGYRVTVFAILATGGLTNM